MPDKPTMRDHWQQAQGYLQIMTTPEAYNLWLKPLRPVGYSNNTLTLAAPDAVVQGKAQRLTRLISNALLYQTDRSIAVEITLAGAPC